MPSQRHRRAIPEPVQVLSPSVSIYCLIALSACEGSLDSRDYAVVMGQRFAKIFSQEWTQVMALPGVMENYGLDKADWDRRRGSKIASIVDGHSLTFQELRYCMECIRDRFHAFTYQHIALDCCPEHGSKLRTACWRCGRSSPATFFTAFNWRFACPSCNFDLGGDRRSLKRSAEVTLSATPLIDWATRSLEEGTSNYEWFGSRRGPPLVPQDRLPIWTRWARYWLIREHSYPFIDYSSKQQWLKPEGPLATQSEQDDQRRLQTAIALDFILTEIGEPAVEEVGEFVGVFRVGDPEYWVTKSLLGTALIRFLHRLDLLPLFTRLWNTGQWKEQGVGLLAKMLSTRSLSMGRPSLEDLAVRQLELIGFYGVCVLQLRRRRSEALLGHSGPPPRSMYAPAVLDRHAQVGVLVRYRFDQRVLSRLVARYRPKQMPVIAGL